jgi:hypothetical protein
LCNAKPTIKNVLNGIIGNYQLIFDLHSIIQEMTIQLQLQ